MFSFFRPNLAIRSRRPLTRQRSSFLPMPGAFDLSSSASKIPEPIAEDVPMDTSMDTSTDSPSTSTSASDAAAEDDFIEQMHRMRMVKHYNDSVQQHYERLENVSAASSSISGAGSSGQRPLKAVPSGVFNDMMDKIWNDRVLSKKMRARIERDWKKLGRHGSSLRPPKLDPLHAQNERKRRMHNAGSGSMHRWEALRYAAEPTLTAQEQARQEAEWARQEAERAREEERVRFEAQRQRREAEERARVEEQQRLEQERLQREAEERQRRKQERREEKRRRQEERERREAQEREQERLRRHAEEDRQRREAEERQFEAERRREEARQHQRERQHREAEAQAAAGARAQATRQDAFKRYEWRWEEIKSGTIAPASLSGSSIGWPIFGTAAADLSAGNYYVTKESISDFLLHPERPGCRGASTVQRVRKELLRWHPDKFRSTVLPLLHEDQREPAARLADQITQHLTSILAAASH